MISNYIQEYFLYPRKPTKHQGIKKIEKFTSAVGPLESQAWAGFRGAQIGPKGTENFIAYTVIFYICI